MTPQSHVPTLRQRVLAANLKILRGKVDLTLDDVVARLGERWSKAKLSRFENGHAVPSEKDLNRLLDLYGVDDAKRADLHSWRAKALERGWWTKYRGIWEGPFVALEDAAKRMRMWEPLVVPGLLQTDQYARAVFEAHRPGDSENEERVLARRTRQALLGRPDAPVLDVLIHETALRLPVGGKDVMRAQIRFLIEAAERPDITLRVAPTEIGAHAGLGGAFVIFDFDQADSFAYAENPAVGNIYEESLDRVQQTILTFERIASAALPVHESVDMLSTLAEE